MQTIPIIKLEIITCAGSAWMIKATYEDGHNTIFGSVKTEKGAAARITMYSKRFGLTKIDRFTAAR